MTKNDTYRVAYDNFTDNEFSDSQWTASEYNTPKEIKTLIESFKLVGRKIKRMKMIGLSYMLRRDEIEDEVYNLLGETKLYTEDELQKKSDYYNIDPELMIGRFSQIDEPLLIEFEDDDILEINTPQEPWFKMSMNKIPWRIRYGTNPRNVDANILFSECIGKTIKQIEVNTYRTKEHPLYFTPFDSEGSERELVSEIIIRLEDGVGLEIKGWIDFCHIACIDRNNQLLKIPFGQLKEGLFNWEDLHEDEILDFEASSGTLFLGSKAAEHIDNLYISLFPGKIDTCASISIKEFVLLILSFVYVKKDWFAEMEIYEFDFDEWKNLLCMAERIVTAKSFDSLFDYLVNLKIEDEFGDNIMLQYLNQFGAELWDKRKKYQRQLNDIKTWTKLVLQEDDVMKIESFQWWRI